MFNLNEQCLEKFIKDHQYVELYYDDESKKVGIMPVNRKAQYTYSIQKRSNTRYGTVHGRAFLKHYGLTPNERTLHTVKWNDEIQLIELSIEDTIDSEAPVIKQSKPTNKPKSSKLKVDNSKDIEL